MIDKEFILSECIGFEGTYHEAIGQEDVKEFIKRIKWELFGGKVGLTDNEMIDIIDKNAGPKLI